jgi:PIN domain nuclease of toxin-antitoxin system
MKLLLDTHAFVWCDSEPSRLSPRAAEACTDPDNSLLLSMASVWEMQIKSQLGKLELRLPLEDIIAHQQRMNSVVLLPILPAHVFALSSLPSHHRDPFDRILITQASIEDAVVVTRDATFSRYSVRVLW